MLNDLLNAQQLADTGQFGAALDVLLNHAKNWASDKKDMLYYALMLRALDALQKDDEFISEYNKFVRHYPESQNPSILLYYFYAKRHDFSNASSALRNCPLTSCETRLRTAIIYKYMQLVIFTHSLEVSPKLAAASPSSPVCDSLAICMMVKDEDDIIRLNLEHHYNLGARKFFVLDNGSTDATNDEIKRFSREHEEALVVVISDPIAGYYQQGKTRALCKYATEYLDSVFKNVSYVLPLDADEFVAFERNRSFSTLLDYFGQQNAELLGIVFDLCDATSMSDWSGDSLEELSNCFATIVYRSKNVVTKNLLHRKCIDNISMGNHHLDSLDIDFANVMPAILHGCRIVHLANRSRKHAIKKINNGGHAYMQAQHLADENFGGHWKRNYQGYVSGGDLFISQYMDSYRNKIAAEIKSPPVIFNITI